MIWTASKRNAVGAICLGELLVDFVSDRGGIRLAEAASFTKAAGGAPANVAAGLARLGIRTAFISKVGQDEFGKFLKHTLQQHGVNTRYLNSTSAASTGLAFVSLGVRGERGFVFYRNRCADELLTGRDIPVQPFRDASIFHFGSISLIRQPSRNATWRAVSLAERKGLLLSFDPNLRPSLWPNEEQARNYMWRGMRKAHVVKLSREELRFLAGPGSLASALSRIWKSPMELCVITVGARGCYYRTRRYGGRVPGYRVRPVDTTGAGDAFVAGLLFGLSRARAQGRAINAISKDELQEILRFANACGALATLKRGAIPALPDLRQVHSFRSNCESQSSRIRRKV